MDMIYERNLIYIVISQDGNNIDGLAQDFSIFSALALEILQSCT